MSALFTIIPSFHSSVLIIPKPFFSYNPCIHAKTPHFAVFKSMSTKNEVILGRELLHSYSEFKTNHPSHPCHPTKIPPCLKSLPYQEHRGAAGFTTAYPFSSPALISCHSTCPFPTNASSYLQFTQQLLGSRHCLAGIGTSLQRKA